MDEEEDELEEEEETRPPIDPELSVLIEARLPESWIPDTTERLRLYRDVAGAESVDQVYEVYQAAVDRFGRAPESAVQLVELMALKRVAANLGLISVGYNSTQMSLGAISAPLISIARKSGSSANTREDISRSRLASGL